MIEECGNIIIHLVGGPMDGDEVRLSPQGSLGPPQQLCYMTVACDQAGWMVYEDEIAYGAWPEEDEAHVFHYVGTYDLGKGKRLT